MLSTAVSRDLVPQPAVVKIADAQPAGDALRATYCSAAQAVTT